MLPWISGGGTPARDCCARRNAALQAAVDAARENGRLSEFPVSAMQPSLATPPADLAAVCTLSELLQWRVARTPQGEAYRVFD